MELVSRALKPIPLVAWGGPALEHCGVEAFVRGYMYIVNESDAEEAANRLLKAGFRRAEWSWSSCDPAKLEGSSDRLRATHQKLIPQYADIDNNSVRFAFPPENDGVGDECVALVLPSYVGLAPPHSSLRGDGKTREAPSSPAGTSMSSPPGLSLSSSPKAEEEGGDKKGHWHEKFTCVDGFLYYPNLPTLLESVIRARLRLPDNDHGTWARMLGIWAISYLWGQTMAPDDILDGIEDERVKNWFNKETKRFEGGIDRVTVTKRRGRLNPGQSAERVDA